MTFPNILDYLVILCFKRQYLKQNTVAHLKSDILAKGVRKGGLGLSLIFYKNFITFARRLSVLAYFLLVNLST